MEKLTVSLQYSPGYIGGGIPHKELNSLQEQLKDEINLVLLPPRAETEKGFVAHHHEIVSFVLYIGGVLGTLSVIKSFLSAFAAEAGKDSYKSLKTLLKKLYRKSVDSSYNVRIHCYVVIPIYGDFVALEFSPGQILTKGSLSEEALEALLTERASELFQYVIDKEQMFRLNKNAYLDGNSVGRIEVISKTGDKFELRLMTHAEFLEKELPVNKP